MPHSSERPTRRLSPLLHPTLRRPTLAERFPSLAAFDASSEAEDSVVVALPPSSRPTVEIRGGRSVRRALVIGPSSTGSSGAAGSSTGSGGDR